MGQQKSRTPDRHRRLGIQSLEKRELLAARISEILVDPLFGDNNQEQYVELRGEPSARLEDTYLLVVSERRPNAGTIHGIFDLNEQAFGSNGYLVMLQSGNPFDVVPGTSVLQSNEEGFGGLPGDIYSDSHPLSERIDFIIGANAYILVQTEVPPVLGQNIDGDGNGTIDENVLENWNVLDSISLHPFVGRGEIAFGEIVFAEIGTGPGEIAVGEGVELIHTEGFGYAGRVGESDGHSSQDWIASTAVNEHQHEELPPVWAMADNLFGEPSQYPYAGRDLDHLGEPNFVGGIRGHVTGPTGEPIVGAEVLADLNENGRRDSLIYVVDPDDVIDHLNPLDEEGNEKTYPLINAYPNVTVTNYALGEFPAHSVTAEKESDFPNTLENRIFAKGGIDWFTKNESLRFDFYRPVNGVSIVGIGSDNPLSEVYARLEAYTAEGELIDSALSSILIDSGRQTISVGSQLDNIAYVLAYADEDHLEGGPFGRFDRMTYSQLEPAATTDEEGYYEIRHLFPATYNVSPHKSGLVSEEREARIVKYENFIENFTMEPNVPPIVEASTFEMAENESVGNVIGTVAGSDPNGHSIRFQLDGEDAAGFTINEQTGEIRVNEEVTFDFESKATYSFAVVVTDPLELSASAEVTVNLQDVNERPNAESSTFTIFELEEIGTVVGSVEASDPDTAQNQSLSFEVVGGSGSEDFAIGFESGTITVAREHTVNDTETKTLEVRVRDNGVPSLSRDVVINIVVRPLNNPPQVEASTFFINETASSFQLVGFVTASDPDPNQSIRFAIAEGNEDLPFFIDAVGAIKVKSGSTFDFETRSEYGVPVTVTDNGVPQKTTTVVQTVQIRDVNERPTIESSSMSVPENAPIGTVVGTVIASDPEESLTFEIVGGTGRELFQVHPTSGEVTVRHSDTLDHETQSQWTIDVQVTDGGEPVFTASATVTISVTDINEAPEVITSVLEVEENATGLLGQILARDDDEGQSLTFELIGGTGSELVEVSESGEVTLKPDALLDFEEVENYSLQVRVSDSGEESRSTVAEVALQLVNVNEKPQFVREWNPPEILTGHQFLFGLGDDPVHDPDGDDWEMDLTVDDGPLPSWLSFDPIELTFSGIPSSYFVGSIEVTLTVFDPDATELASSTSVPLVINVSAEPLHNMVIAHDVDASDEVTSGDALRIINYIARESDPNVNASVRANGFYDVTRDNKVTARDALVVINELARLVLVTEGELVIAAPDDDRNDAALLDYLSESSLF